MFSRRTSWSRTPNRWTEAVEHARARPGVIDLTGSNPTKVGLASALEGIARTSEKIYSPEPLGLWTARVAVSEYYARRDLAVAPERVVLVASTSEAYAHLFRMLTDSGDTVALPQPSYPLLDYLARLADLQAQPYTLAYDGSWHLDRARFEAAARGAKVVVLVSPNNPTGTVFSANERRLVRETALRHQQAIVSDEVFADYAASHAQASWVDETEVLSFSMGGLSKAVGIPQAKLSWIVVSGPESLAQEALGRLEIVGDTFLSVATDVQLDLPTILAAADAWQVALRSRIASNRVAMSSLLLNSACDALRGRGGWSALIQLPRIKTDEAWAVELAELGVITQPGYLFDLPLEACLAVSLITSPEVFAAGIERIVAHGATA